MTIRQRGSRFCGAYHVAAVIVFDVVGGQPGIVQPGGELFCRVEKMMSR